MKGLLEEISKGLADNIQLLSSWDKYRKEACTASGAMLGDRTAQLETLLQRCSHAPECCSAYS